MNIADMNSCDEAVGVNSAAFIFFENLLTEFVLTNKIVIGNVIESDSL